VQPADVRQAFLRQTDLLPKMPDHFSESLCQTLSRHAGKGSCLHSRNLQTRDSALPWEAVDVQAARRFARAWVLDLEGEMRRLAGTGDPASGTAGNRARSEPSGS
jgi:hypothetical protein